MLPITLSIFACFGWGIADFLGGLNSRSVPTLIVLMISTLVGTVLLTIILLLSNQPLPNDPRLLWAIPAGIVGIIAMFLLYRSLAIGTMSILAPISATGVVLPVIWGIFSGDTLSNLCMLGIAIAMLGLLMAVMENDKAKKTKRLTKGVGLAVGAALFVGLYYITMDVACAKHPIWASMIMRTSALIILLPVLIFTKTTMRMNKIQLLPIFFMGVMDTMATFCFAMATSKGMLSQVAVISALYPAVTVLLSAVIIGERIQKIQFVGVVLAVTGITFISAF